MAVKYINHTCSIFLGGFSYIILTPFYINVMKIMRFHLKTLSRL